MIPYRKKEPVEFYFWVIVEFGIKQEVVDELRTKNAMPRVRKYVLLRPDFERARDFIRELRGKERTRKVNHRRRYSFGKLSYQR